MKEYRSSTGERRLWFEENEIDQIMEDELRRGDMFPGSTHPAMDVKSFLEVHLGVKLDQHAPLESDLLGQTTLSRGSRPLVQINRDLTLEAEGTSAPSGKLGRWRATLAHEAAHVILHRKFFEAPSEQASFFDAGSRFDHGLMKCSKLNVSFNRGPGDWKEVQANRGMASLLMPRSLFPGLVHTVVGAGGDDDLLAHVPETDSAAHAKLVKELSKLCEVSREAARIRLETLGLTRSSNEPMLGVKPTKNRMSSSKGENHGN